MNFRIVFLICFWALFSCAQKQINYQRAGGWDPVGFSEEKIQDGVFDVSFTAQVKPTDIGEFLLIRRCAELTIQEGFDWFYFYTKNIKTKVRNHVEFPHYYGRIFMKNGTLEKDGIDARQTLLQPIPYFNYEN